MVPPAAVHARIAMVYCIRLRFRNEKREPEPLMQIDGVLVDQQDSEFCSIFVKDTALKTYLRLSLWLLTPARFRSDHGYPERHSRIPAAHAAAVSSATAGRWSLLASKVWLRRPGPRRRPCTRCFLKCGVVHNGSAERLARV